jgi:hypothetical protein
MTASFRESLLKVEELRRESPSFNNYPSLPGLDYAEPGMKISLAMHHLDEALPNGQRERALAAMMMLESGTHDLRRYLSVRLSSNGTP